MHDPFLKPVFADPRMAEILIGLRASCSGVLEADREDLGPGWCQ